MSAHYILNEKLNGVEIYFGSKPEEEIRTQMKNAGFRWKPQKENGGYWYARQSENTLALAAKLGEKGIGVVRPEKKAKEKSAHTPKETIITNAEFGVSMGDLFILCFGYDATMFNYFEVVGFKGKCTVLLRQVCAQHLGGSFMCWQEKPIKDKFKSDEVVTCRLRKVGNTVYAGKYYQSSWDRVFDCDDYH